MPQITSMTGFGSGSAETDRIRVRAVLRSVNGRFLDLAIRCPSALQELEPRLRDRVQARLSRGKVTGTIDYEETAHAGGLPQVDLQVAERYVAELGRLASSTGQEPVGLDVVARLPGVFRTESSAPDLGDLEPLVMAAVDAALDELEQMRLAEGATLAADLRARLATVAELTDRIEALATAGRQEVHRRLREKVEGLLKPGEMNEDRLATEIVLIAERSDITEELVRLRSHVEQFLATLDSAGEVGRRLNFLLQEMHREINTISSKSSEGELIHRAVEAKEEVERLREQVQNLA